MAYNPEDYDTVRGHMTAGALTAKQRASTDDLWAGVEWLEAYEGTADDPTLRAMATAAAFLRREIARRGR